MRMSSLTNGISDASQAPIAEVKVSADGGGAERERESLFHHNKHVNNMQQQQQQR